MIAVCLHGFLESSNMWKMINWKKLGLQALLIDLPGHGKSSFSPKVTKSKELFFFNTLTIFFDPITSPEYLFENGFLVEIKRIFFIYFLF